MTLSAAHSDGGILDQTNGAIIVQDEVHTSVHKGILFHAGRFVVALAADATIVLLIQVAAGQSAHMRFGLAAGGDTEVELFEGPTFSAAGTTITPLNRNRFSSNTAQTTITHTPTTSADGTELAHTMMPGGTGPAQSPGDTGGSFSEWILKTGEDYLFRVTNRSGAAQPTSLSLDFYEA
jgi:hypothetical protein